MTRRAVATMITIATLVAVAQPSIAQDEIAPIESRVKPSVLTPLPLVKPTKRFTNRVMFVVDVSGSMQDPDRRLNDAYGAVSCMTPQIATDDTLVACLAFNDSLYRWVPPAEPNTPKLWSTAFPDQMGNLSAWLQSKSGSGGTQVVSAINGALDEDVDDLTVVLITDGEFNGTELIGVVQAAQAKREFKQKARAVVMVWGVGIRVHTKTTIWTLGELGGGGFWIGTTPDSGPVEIERPGPIEGYRLPPSLRLGPW